MGINTQNIHWSPELIIHSSMKNEVQMCPGYFVEGTTLQQLLESCKGKSLTYPTVTSKMLLPIELETAMSPNPFLATRTLVIKSGILVPAARNVRPIIWKV
ncbi:hypothetical protein CDAR_7021 [Caerostris darwini]|uniref:Uncharacterized protein n=1 Tax=Caerostris darwini TaxID=1538125 RepID=A0AAV4PHV6_9ARAC|nr:hypothetical protein CDAR_7021 [Caerostris darwini]